MAELRINLLLPTPTCIDKEKVVGGFTTTLENRISGMQNILSWISKANTFLLHIQKTERYYGCSASNTHTDLKKMEKRPLGIMT